jgi:hypothetical protein
MTFVDWSDRLEVIAVESAGNNFFEKVGKNSPFSTSDCGYTAEPILMFQ